MLALATGLLLACSPEEGDGTRDVAEVGKSSVKVGSGEGTGSVFGNYLAGRFAENEADLDFAANMMERVLEENPSDPAILRRAFVLNLGAGNGKRAVELADLMNKLGGTLTSATLLLLAHDLKQGKPDEALKKFGDLLLDKARDSVEGVDDIQARILDDDPAHAILECAKDESADMIVIGSRGVGDLKSLLLGSVSHKLIEHAECPCVVVK